MCTAWFRLTSRTKTIPYYSEPMSIRLSECPFDSLCFTSFAMPTNKFGGGCTHKFMCQHRTPDLHCPVFILHNEFTIFTFRFAIEYDLDVAAAGNSYLTADQPTKEIPPGHYDSGDGFYNAKTRSVFKYEDPTRIVRYGCCIVFYFRNLLSRKVFGLPWNING